MLFSPSPALHCLILKAGPPSALHIWVVFLAPFPFSCQSLSDKQIDSCLPDLSTLAVNFHLEGKFFKSLGRIAKSSAMATNDDEDEGKGGKRRGEESWQ